jgi:hypothetical protein
VALSRATDLQGLTLSSFLPAAIKAHDKVKHFYASIGYAQDGIHDDSTTIITSVKALSESYNLELAGHADDPDEWYTSARPSSSTAMVPSMFQRNSKGPKENLSSSAPTSNFKSNKRTLSPHEKFFSASSAKVNVTTSAKVNVTSSEIQKSASVLHPPPKIQKLEASIGVANVPPAAKQLTDDERRYDSNAVVVCRLELICVVRRIQQNRENALQRLKNSQA